MISLMISDLELPSDGSGKVDGSEGCNSEGAVSFFLSAAAVPILVDFGWVKQTVSDSELFLILLLTRGHEWHWDACWTVRMSLSQFTTQTHGERK